MKAWDSLAAAFGNRKLLTTVAVLVAVSVALGASPASAVAPAPEVTLNTLFNAYKVTPTSALLKGFVNPDNSKVSDCHFVYGVGSASGNTAPCDPPHPAVDETQAISVNATSGQFKLSFESETTGDLPFDATAAEVRTALESLASIGSGNVEVSGGPGGPAGISLESATPYVVVFVEDLSGENLPQIVAEEGSTPLAGGVDIRTTEQGGGSFDERQRIAVNAVSGQYRLTFGSETTPDLPYYAGRFEIQSALEGLASIGSGNVLVSEKNEQVEGHYQNYYIVTFLGALAGQDVPQITASSGTEPLKGAVGVVTRADGSLTTPVAVSAQLTGLSPETEYRFKLVATNGAGTAESDEQSFRTTGPAPECPNEARRQEQHFFPAECRAFELVSPTEKNNSPILGERTNVAVAADGNRAFFLSRGGFAGTIGSGQVGVSNYLSQRGASGWETKAVTPTPATSALQILTANTIFSGLFDEDLHHVALWAYDLPQAQGDIPDNQNFYRMDMDSGAIETLSSSASQEGPTAYLSFLSYAGRVWGASSDMGVISFPSQTKLLPNPEIPEAGTEGFGTPNTYEWDHGTLRLAGILPDGHVPAGGSTPPDYRASVSSDGSRVMFLAPAQGNQQLYMRRNHSNTVWISEPESAGFSGEPENVTLQWVSPNAQKILFTTTSNLVDEDTDGEVDLYLYTDGPNPSAEPHNLQLITHAGETPNMWESNDTVLGVSEDATRIYYITTEGWLRFWEAGAASTRQLLYGTGAFENEGSSKTPGSSRTSPDGRIFAFRHDAQMYVYDAARDTLNCASCAIQGPTTGTVPAWPEVNHTSPQVDLHGLRPQFLSADGKTVFFTTTSALVPEDTNGVQDVYAYDTTTGDQRLVSSGKGDQGEWFVNASPSGNDVFFVTNQALIGRDGDGLADLYDARVGGGFVEPPPPPAQCSGDGCRGPLSSSQGAPTPATASFSGPGNPHHHKKVHKHKKRHHRKHHHHAKHHHHKKGARR